MPARHKIPANQATIGVLHGIEMPKMLEIWRSPRRRADWVLPMSAVSICKMLEKSSSIRPKCQ